MFHQIRYWTDFSERLLPTETITTLNTRKEVQKMSTEYTYQVEKQRTSTGLTLLVIGLLLSWIPYIRYVGDLLILIGAIFVILGRAAFGPKHELYVKLAIVLFIIALIAAVVVALDFAFSIFTDVNSAPKLVGDFKNYMIGLIVVAVIGGSSYILLVYGISDSLGIKLLLMAFVLQIVITIVVFVVVMPTISSAIYSMSSGNLKPLDSLSSKISDYGLLNVFPLLIYAFAYYRAKNNIENKSLN